MKHPNIKIVEGKIPILISAPHAVKIKRMQKKNGQNFKPHEVKVAKIVNELCNTTGAWGIFTQKDSDEKHIENWENDIYHIYKNNINNLIASNKIVLFLDIHGSQWNRPFQIDYDFLIPNLHSHDEMVENILTTCIQEQFPKITLSNGFFRELNGPGKNTLTRHVRNRFAIPAIQIEINKQIRANKNNYSLLLDALHKFIKKYENTLAGI